MSPAGKREALIVAVSDYRDPKLRKLRAPAADADRLATVLRDPEIGGFDVELVADPEVQELRRRLATFFGVERRPDDLLLVHFSCHGVKDESNELYLAAADTQEDLLAATGIDASWLNRRIGRCRSKRIVVLLDCCFSGSFPFGARPRAGAAVNVEAHLEGRGRAVITASNSMEYAYEGDQLTGQGQPSVFTDAVVEGLRSGEADRDGDRRISIQELYDYVFDRVKETQPAQTPTMMSTLEGPLHIAHSSYEPPVEPAQLDRHLVGLINSPVAAGRLGAVEELARLVRSDDRASALAARQALERMVDDDSRRVAAAADDALASVAAPVPPEPALPTVQRPTGTDWAAAGREVLRVEHAEGGLADVAFSPDGRYLATASDDNTARVWDFPGGRQRLQVEHKSSLYGVAFSPDGHYLATASIDNTARVWQLTGGREVLRVKHEDTVFDVAFSPDGRYLATASGDKTARVWELIGGREVLRVKHKNTVWGVAISPDGRHLATASRDETARVTELPGAREVLRVEHEDPVADVAFSPDGRYLATVSWDETARLWELPGGGEVLRIKGRFVDIALSPDGRYLATASEDYTARMWELPGGGEALRVEHEDTVWGVAVSPDGRYLATASDDSTARVWEPES